MEDFDAHFFATVDDQTYQIIPSDGESFLILLAGVKVGGICKDLDSLWQWTDSNLSQDFAAAIGEIIQKRIDENI